MAGDLAKFAAGARPGWSRAYFLFNWDGDSFGSPGSSCGSESEATLIDTFKHRDFCESMKAKGRKLCRLTGRPKGLFLLIAKSDLTHEIRFEYKKLGRWRITKLDGGTGVPDGLE
jgi:hypothetical protein